MYRGTTLVPKLSAATVQIPLIYKSSQFNEMVYFMYQQKWEYRLEHKTVLSASDEEQKNLEPFRFSWAASISIKVFLTLSFYYLPPTIQKKLTRALETPTNHLFHIESRIVTRWSKTNIMKIEFIALSFRARQEKIARAKDVRNTQKNKNHQQRKTRTCFFNRNFIFCSAFVHHEIIQHLFWNVVCQRKK